MLNQSFVKRTNARSKSGKQGGNKMPQTFKICESCKKEFGPVSYLKKKFCTYACKVVAQSTGRKTFRITVAKARYAQSLIAYHVKVGNMVRPKRCEECKETGRKIEAAHFNYEEPLKVRWLCQSCHRKWDKAFPKGATVKRAAKQLSNSHA